MLIFAALVMLEADDEVPSDELCEETELRAEENEERELEEMLGKGRVMGKPMDEKLAFTDAYTLETMLDTEADTLECAERMVCS